MNQMVAEAIAHNSGYLGVITGEALTAQSSQLFFGVDSVRGMLVESVDPGGAAERAGIMPGDVITRVRKHASQRRTKYHAGYTQRETGRNTHD